MIVWICIQTNPMMAFAAVVGSTGFFIVSGFRTNAEQAEQQLVEGKTSLSDWSKILYLEIIDATFSIDGVIGAFAFTLSVPLILLGNGIGAFVVREVTIRHVDQVKKYPFLKNGAMYSIAFLGMIMLMDGFGFHIPPWVSPIFTISIVVFFLVRSIRYNGMAQVNDPAAAFPDLFSIADEPSPENGLIPDRNDK